MPYPHQNTEETNVSIWADHMSSSMQESEEQRRDLGPDSLLCHTGTVVKKWRGVRIRAQMRLSAKMGGK